jgi:glycosyltransferase involved in cell wall biosynthesis
MIKASIIITTKNRKEDLRVAVTSAINQSINPEVIIIDDGSTDGTDQMIQNEFPSVLFKHFQDSKGYIFRRNEGASIASGEVIISIDDDAEFSSPYVVDETLKGFSDLRIGAIAIPYIEPLKANVLLQNAPEKEGIWLTDRFIGTAHAVRRDLFLKMGGYRNNLIHQGEEGDFCIRMLELGFYVKLGTSDPIIHYESIKRSYERMDFYGCRNSILFLWQNIPWLFLPIYLVRTSFNCLKWTFIPRRFLIRLRGIICGFYDCLKATRFPVSSRTFFLWNRLKKAPRLIDEL